ncbi:hypothetical protein Tco_1350984 [Tanacetum coccineum]
MNLNNHFTKENINLASAFTRKVGDGTSFSFWNDHWIGESNLRTLFPRLFLLESIKGCCIFDRCIVSTGPVSRSWARRRPIRGGRETDQFNNLNNLLNEMLLIHGTMFFTTQESSLFRL